MYKKEGKGQSYFVHARKYNSAEKKERVQRLRKRAMPSVPRFEKVVILR